mgnify:FL=1|tara:strand:- start:411 stop:641 length:231 start_codon:yes stop_codon:yes gene_type:complete
MINNKQILGQLKASIETLNSVISSKDELLNDVKKEMSKKDLKEFQTLEKLMNKKLKDNDFNGAMNVITKFKMSKKD